MSGMVKNEMISIELAPTGNGNNSNESGPSAASASSVVALQAQVVSLKKSHNRLLGGFLVVLILAIVGLALGAKEAVKAGLVSRSDVLLDGSPKAIRGYTEGVAVYQGMGEWVTKAKLPEALSDMAVVECGGKIYLLGGMTKDGATGALTNTTIAYDPIYETSSFMAPMPNPRYRFGAACDDGVIYVAGGFTYKQGFGADATAIVEAYNVTSNTWTAMASASMGRGDVAVSAANGKLYVIGGYGPDYDMSASGTMTEELDIASNTWTVKAAMPTSRGDVSAVAIGGEIYVVGGWSESVYPANPDPLTTLEKYSPATDTWTVLPAMFVPRGDAAVVVSEGPDGPMLMVAGGETVSAIKAAAADPGSCWIPGGCLPVHDVEMYNIKHKVWTKMAPSALPRYRFGAAYYAGTVYAFGGHTHGEVAIRDVETFYYVPHRDAFLHYKMTASMAVGR